MKRLIIAAAVASTSTVAFAADLPIYQPAPMLAPTPIAFNWTGFYVGAQTGWAFGDADASFDNGAPGLSLDPDGFVVGAHAGYNHQFGRFVAGVEADAEWAEIDGDDSSLAGITSDSSIDVNWQASIRGRLGAALDRVLLYVTGGGAYADVDVDGGPVGGPFGSFSDGAWGWTLGAGIEAAVTDHITARVEYRYSDFGDVDGSVAPGVTESVDLQTHAVRAGVSWKF